MSGEEATGNEKPNFQGKYKLVRNENFESFLEANGANWMVRKMAASASPDLELVQDGNKFQLKLQSMFHSRDSSFTIGETYEETQQNGIVMKVTPKWDGNKLVLDYVPKEEDKGGKTQKHTRELQGDEMILTLEVGDVVAKRIFKKAS